MTNSRNGKTVSSRILNQLEVSSRVVRVRYWELWDHVPTLGKGSCEQCGPWSWYGEVADACYIFNDTCLSMSLNAFPQKTAFFFFLTQSNEIPWNRCSFSKQVWKTLQSMKLLEIHSKYYHNKGYKKSCIKETCLSMYNLGSSKIYYSTSFLHNILTS